MKILVIISLAEILCFFYSYCTCESTFNNTSIIPLNIFQTWFQKELPTKMNECVQSIKKDNPEFTHYLYSDQDCREFIKNNFDIKVLNAFDILIPGAYKADLWRYCILYKCGGVYLDIKYKCINKFKFISLITEEHFVKDEININNKHHTSPKNKNNIKAIGVQTAFMMCKPGNKILLKSINKIVENVQNRYYGENPLVITGPKMVINFFNENDKKALETIYFSNQTFTINNGLNILQMYSEYRKEQKISENKERYHDLWLARKIKLLHQFLVKYR